MNGFMWPEKLFLFNIRAVKLGRFKKYPVCKSSIKWYVETFLKLNRGFQKNI